jgi:cell division transport system permease protein
MSGIAYFFSTGFKSFFRNGFMSLAAIVILISAMLICGSFMIVNYNIEYSIQQVDDFNEIVVFAELSATDEQIAEMQEKILMHDNVASCTLVKKEDSIRIEKERYGDEYSYLFERYINNESENPLPDKFHIEYHEVNKLDTLESYLLTEVDHVWKVNVRKDIADSINQIKQVINVVCVFLTALLLVVSVFIIGNTIKITLKAREKEITIMRYIGATNAFITLPFIVESAIVALISSITASVIQLLSYKVIVDQVVSKFNIVETIPLSAVWAPIVLCFVLISFVLCFVCTILSTRSYMNA